jgi:hypothetical protein
VSDWPPFNPTTSADRQVPPTEADSNESRTRRLRAPIRVVILTLGTVAGAAGVCFAMSQFFQHEIKRLGGEQRAVVQISAPFGSLVVGSTSTPGTIAYIEGHGEDGEEPDLRTRYVIKGTTGILNISLGDGEQGSREIQPPLASTFRANTQGFVLTGGQRYTEDGKIVNITAPRRYAAAPAEYGSRVFLTKELPLALDAEMGFGESMLDLSGLWLQDLNLETGANQARVLLRSPNPGSMNQCMVSAGVGEFTMDGIGHLNTSRYIFNGGFGVYNLNFNGKLKKNIDANISVGVGKVNIRIPPADARVQVVYEDGVLCSYTFQGLTKKRDGYATSAGFENSRAPIITLRLTSGAGRINVIYK